MVNTNMDYSIKDIKRDYHLNELITNKTNQIENIAESIQLLYFYKDLLNNNQLTKITESGICRQVHILTYSILEGIIICLGYKMQKNCSNCIKHCKYYSDSMFGEDQKKQEKLAFNNAYTYLTKIGVINFLPGWDKFFKDFREDRNDVHLSKNTKEIISNNPSFTRLECNKKLQFFQDFVDGIYANYRNFYRYCNSVK